MKVHNRVTQLERGFWPKGEKVIVSQEWVFCLPAYERAYDLARCYKFDPHVALIKSKTQEDLIHFVRTWGPLHLEPGTLERGVSRIPARTYWSFQRRLKALVGLLRGFKTCRNERESLWEFLLASQRWHETTFIYPAVALSSEAWVVSAYLLADPECGAETARLGPRPPAPGKALAVMETWLKRVSTLAVRKATAHLIQATLQVTATVEAIWQTRPPQIRERWQVHNLKEALEWMVWQDERLEHPLLFCEECRDDFRPESAHKRKYCTYRCAHRVAVRNWRKARSRKK